MGYAWVITHGEDGSKGQHNYTSERYRYLMEHAPTGTAHQWRVKDDDDHIYAHGLLWVHEYGGEELFAPLDDYAAPMWGCTSIEYLEAGRWVLI